MRRPSFLVPVGVAIAALLPQGAGAQGDGSGTHTALADPSARRPAGRITQPLLALAHAAGATSRVLGHSSHSSHASHASHASSSGGGVGGHVSHASHASHTSHMSSSGTPAPPAIGTPSVGSVAPATQIRFAANLTVRAEVPQPKGATRSASGKWTASLNGNVLTWRLTLSHLSSAATASFIHIGLAGQVGPQLVHICGPCSSPATGKVTLSSAQRAALIAGLTYINLGTVHNPDGEIRGQVRRVS